MEMLSESGMIGSEILSIIENTNDLMFVKNRDFVYIACSKSFAKNCVRCNGPEEVIGKTDFELFGDPCVAQRYREDDESLFASGKRMIEFQEEFLDEKGQKHFCLTTKYLLHDKKGNPIAILGQYHDIEDEIEAEIERRKDMDYRVARSINAIFYVSFLVNIQDYSFSLLKGNEFVKREHLESENILELWNAFIQGFVDSEDQDKVREFCTIDTIAERLKDRTHIGCVYRRIFIGDWIQASFLPVSYDENGQLTDVLFVLSNVDQIRAQSLDEGATSRKDLETIFNKVPGGIVLYEWNGKKLKVLRMSQYYQDMYGYSMINTTSSPDFLRVHPNDLAEYRKAIYQALNETHHLEYVFRVWSHKLNQYSWAQINAISYQQPDGTSLVYALYSDVTTQKALEQRLGKSHATLKSALGASNQSIYEYDPKLHVGECLTERLFFGLPRYIENVPECFRSLDLFHPDDVEKFIETTYQMDAGKDRAQCDVRIKKDGEYCWYSCMYFSYFDVEKGYHTAILSVLDISFRMDVIQSYKDRLYTLQKSNEDALCMCDVNLTRNQFNKVQADTAFAEFGIGVNTLDELINQASEMVLDASENQQYRKLFKKENLLALFEEGESHIALEHFYRTSETNTVWSETIFELMTEPMTGDIVGIFYIRDLNRFKLSNMLVNTALGQDYPMTAFVYADTGEYYLYEVGKQECCTHKQNFWQVSFERLAESIDEQNLAEVRRNLTKEKVMSFLENHEEYVYVFFGTYFGHRLRLEVKFRYVDKKRHLLIATLRNITDEVLAQQYKYDSEHDSLTGLYNRAAAFREARTLLDAHPNEQFVMMHIDIQHFHLYNTFFGEEEGDKLLCKIADILRRVESVYDYLVCARIESDVFCIFFALQGDSFERHVHMFVDELEQFSPEFPLRMAMGAYWVEDPTMSIETMFARATIAAKSHKNNLFQIVSRYDDAMNKNLRDTQQITSEMVSAVEEKQFQVYLQPKYSLRSEKIVGAEALVRWHHPERGMISPGKFIPIFEQNGFIVTLDRYMWESVCQILRRWLDEGKTMYPVSVNISRVSMYSHATVPFLKSLIQKYQLDPKYLELELTETAYMDDPEDLKRMLKELQEFGFNILMDDFGSGYSSLNTLRELPVNVLKLDMNFLAMSHNDQRGGAILSSIVRMSKLLHLPIVAEGVEEKGQANYLRDIGCEYVQGFLFSRPVSVSDYERLLPTVGELQNYEIDLSKENIANDIQPADSLISLGMVEYVDGHFVYLHTNRRFLTEFGLLENMDLASNVFREHLDDKNYSILIQAFENSATTKQPSMFVISWKNHSGKIRQYHGFVSYHGKTGAYADLSVVFINVTETRKFRFEDAVDIKAYDVNNQYDTESQYVSNAKQMVQAIDNTGVRMFMYFPQTKTITVPEKTCFAYQCLPFYENMPESFANDFVLPSDHHIFNEMYYRIDRGEKIADAVFHSKDQKYCNHVTLTTVSWSEDGKPKEVFGLIENYSEQFKSEQFIQVLQKELFANKHNSEMDDALKHIALAIGRQYYAVYYIWLETHTYTCLQEKSPGILSVIGEKGDYEEAWEKYINGYIEESDHEKIRQFIDISTLAQRIGTKDSITHNYQRKEIGWTRGQFIPGRRDENGRLLTVIYTVSDINEEVENKKKREIAEQEAMRDSLTGLWNRKAFEQFKQLELFTKHPTGLLLFDIDRFKNVNDQFGHEFGDYVIKTVCNQVRNALRHDDLVFRVGGDEFAVLLYNCEDGIWNSICRKLVQIHSDVKDLIQKEVTVTLSMGLCLNPDGYCDAMYHYADQALYHTKANGRGGCTMIDLQGNVLREWHDTSIALRKGDTLEQNSTVIWRMQVPKETDVASRAYGDSLFTTFIDKPQYSTPEEFYQAWFKRINPDYYEIAEDSIRAAITNGRSESVLFWNHPEKGNVQIRCSFYLDSEFEDYHALIGYMHITTGTHIFTLEDIGNKVRSALEEMFLCNFYIRLSDYSFRVYKAQPYMETILSSCTNASDAINLYTKEMVSAGSAEDVARFLDLSTIQQRMRQVNIISATYHDKYIGDARARFVAVNRNKSGALEAVSLIVESV